MAWKPIVPCNCPLRRRRHRMVGASSLDRHALRMHRMHRRGRTVEWSNAPSSSSTGLVQRIGQTCRMRRKRRLRTRCEHHLRHRRAAASTFQSRAPRTCSRRGWASTRGRTTLSALGSYTSAAVPPVASTSTMTPGVQHVLAHVTPSARPHRPPARPHARSHDCDRTASPVAFVVAAKAGRSTRRPTGWPESTGQRARPPAHTRRMALGPRGMAAPSAATTASRWCA